MSEDSDIQYNSEMFEQESDTNRNEDEFDQYKEQDSQEPCLQIEDDD